MFISARNHYELQHTDYKITNTMYSLVGGDYRGTVLQNPLSEALIWIAALGIAKIHVSEYADYKTLCTCHCLPAGGGGLTKRNLTS